MYSPVESSDEYADEQASDFAYGYGFEPVLTDEQIANRLEQRRLRKR